MFENGVLRRIFGPKSGSERRIEKITWWRTSYFLFAKYYLSWRN
jgi:hypothetical protein